MIPNKFWDKEYACSPYSALKRRLEYCKYSTWKTPHPFLGQATGMGECVGLTNTLPWCIAILEINKWNGTIIMK